MAVLEAVDVWLMRGVQVEVGGSDVDASEPVDVIEKEVVVGIIRGIIEVVDVSDWPKELD